MIEETNETYRVDAVECAVDIVRIIAGEAGLGPSDIARRLSTSRQRVFRMLRTLEGCGLLERDANGRGYRLGYMALVVGEAARTQSGILRVAEPVMSELGRAAQETVQLRVRDRWETVCVGRWEPEREIRVRAVVGRRRPLHAGSSKALLAFLPEREREEYLARDLVRLTGRTRVEPMALRSDLAEVRSQGWCMSKGEVSDDLMSVAAPVFDGSGSVLACLSIAAPAIRVDERRGEDLSALVVAAAARISGSLAHPVGSVL